MEALSPQDTQRFTKRVDSVEIEGSVMPPPYTIAVASKAQLEECPTMDSLIYQKMLNLESMVSNIHDSVVDQGTFLDVSIQLKEINESMQRFQQEASVRLRKKLEGSLHFSSRPNSSCSRTSHDSEVTLSPINSPDPQDFLQEDKQHIEDNVRYQRVCALLENLITDANSVLNDSPELSPTTIQLAADELAQFKYEAQRRSDEMGVRPSHEQEVLAAVHEIPSQDAAPILDNGVDLERLSLPPSDQITLGSRSMNNYIESILTSTDSIPRTIFSLFYWASIFIIGSILFDSSLCSVSGSQVISLFNSVSGEIRSRRRFSTTGAPRPPPTLFPIPNHPPAVIARRKSF
ncbi:hypothetical protein L0F63_003302 [Massospora cicadina]|nr:hypothetical protein L0F63_003302 [Massospora cicadina]